MNDKQLKQLLAEHKQEITDSGFSNKVMHRLPDKQRTPGLVWIFAAISTIIVLLSGSYTTLIHTVLNLMSEIHWWVIPAASCVIAMILLSVFVFHERKDNTISFNLNI
jgi:hypothetical protein